MSKLCFNQMPTAYIEIFANRRKFSPISPTNIDGEHFFIEYFLSEYIPGAEATNVRSW